MKAQTLVRRWGLLVVAALVGVLLLVTGIGRYMGGVRLAEMVALDQGDALAGAVHAELRQHPRHPERANLKSVVDAHDELHYIAVLDPGGRRVAQAGVAPTDDRLRPPGLPLIVGDQARLVSHMGPPPPPREAPVRAKSQSPRRQAPRMLIVYSPASAMAVLAAGLRDLLVNVVGALLLLVAAAMAWRVSRRAETAEAALEQQRHLAALGEMSAVMAHEIRNPLAALKGHAQLLEERLDPEGRDHKKAQRVVRSAERLEALTTDLLEFARSGCLNASPQDPTALLRQAAVHLPDGRVRIETIDAPKRWNLDGPRMHRALVNLLDNAVQASVEPVQATVRFEGASLVYEVRDHGEGVPQDVRGNLFEPFVTGRTRGTGLGLAIAQRIVHLHGGTLEHIDPPDGGAIFRITVSPES